MQMDQFLHMLQLVKVFSNTILQHKSQFFLRVMACKQQATYHLV